MLDDDPQLLRDIRKYLSFEVPIGPIAAIAFLVIGAELPALAMAVNTVLSVGLIAFCTVRLRRLAERGIE